MWIPSLKSGYLRFSRNLTKFLVLKLNIIITLLDILILGYHIFRNLDSIEKKMKNNNKDKKRGAPTGFKKSLLYHQRLIHKISFSLIGASNQSKKTYYYLHPFAWCHGLMVWLLVTTEVKGGMRIGLQPSFSPIQRPIGWKKQQKDQLGALLN